MTPTYEELKTKLIDTKAKLVETQRLLKLAIDRIAALEERLNKNFDYSSKPPSTDQKSNYQGGGGKRTPRDKGFNRPLFPLEKVELFITCSLEACPRCGSSQLERKVLI